MQGMVDILRNIVDQGALVNGALSPELEVPSAIRCFMKKSCQDEVSVEWVM